MPCWWLPVDSYHAAPSDMPHLFNALLILVTACWQLPTALADNPYLPSALLMLMTACWQLPHCSGWYSLPVQFCVDVDDCLLTATIQHQLIFLTSLVLFCTCSAPCWCWWLPVDSHHTAPTDILYLFGAILHLFNPMLMLMTACWQLPYSTSLYPLPFLCHVDVDDCLLTATIQKQLARCPHGSLLNYVIVIPYLFNAKLIFITLLYAMFAWVSLLFCALWFGVNCVLRLSFSRNVQVCVLLSFIHCLVLSRSTVSVQTWAETVFLLKHWLNTLESILIECCRCSSMSAASAVRPSRSSDELRQSDQRQGRG